MHTFANLDFRLGRVLKMHAAYGAFLHRYGMINLSNSPGVPDFLELSFTKNTLKKTPMIF